MSLLIRQPRLLCQSCQSRSRAFHTTVRRLASQPPNSPPDPAAKTNPADGTPKSAATTATTAAADSPAQKFVAPAALPNAPRSYGKRLDEFEPVPLPRPIGLPYPPEIGQNTGIETRSWRQRRNDFVDYDKHLERRKYLFSKMARPYFRDWGNLRFRKGKTFIAPPRLFKAELSLYFPNLYGRVLRKADYGSGPRDTTPTLQGRVSVVSLFSNLWAENQCKTFVSEAQNPGAMRLLADNANSSVAQHVRVNIEDDALRGWLSWLFMGQLRRQVPGDADQARYFMVRKGISDEIREGIGFLNSKVGYTYLLDADCKIRWAGCADSEDHEREGLVKGLQRLLSEHEARKK
ncbi:ATP10 protein-domain-containing protein [Nemania sp. FL0916]|nr:ATP10 protein-domain-containing protein [Nemania sp. FL0916]